MKDPDVSEEHIDSICRVEKKFRLILPPVSEGVSLDLLYKPEDGGILRNVQNYEPENSLYFGDTCHLRVVTYSGVHSTDDSHSVSEPCYMSRGEETQFL
jgi:hypothetical protein